MPAVFAFLRRAAALGLVAFLVACVAPGREKKAAAPAGGGLAAPLCRPDLL